MYVEVASWGCVRPRRPRATCARTEPLLKPDGGKRKARQAPPWRGRAKIFVESGANRCYGRVLLLLHWMSKVQETPIQDISDLPPEDTVKKLRLVKSDLRHTVCIGCVHDMSHDGLSVTFSYCGNAKKAHEPKYGMECIPWERLRPMEADHRCGGSGEIDLAKKSTTLKWRIHDIGARRSQEDSKLDTNPSVVELELGVRHADKLQLALGSTPDGDRFVSRLRVSEQFCICLEHRRLEAALNCFCADAIEKAISIGPVQQPDKVVRWGSTSDYITFWKTLLEIEAVTIASDDVDSKVMTGVDVTWKDKQTGVFRLPCSTSAALGLRFRSLISGGQEEFTELSSSWICIRRHNDSDCEGGWAVHGAVTSVYLQSKDGHWQKIEAPGQGVDFDGCSLDKLREGTISSMKDAQLVVAFRITSGSTLGEEVSTGCTMDVLSKTAPQTCVALALADFFAGPTLVKQVVLHACASMEVSPRSDDLTDWALNESQEQAARMALEEPLSLIHGPPGTGKTRTAAALAAIFALQNKEMDDPPCVLYCSPSNEVADHACMSVQSLAADYLRKRLASRSQQAARRKAEGIPASEECTICLGYNCDTVTACAHVFHQKCLNQAMAAGRHTCPICFLPFELSGAGLDVVRAYSVEVERADFPVQRRFGTSAARHVRTVSPELRKYALHWRCHGVAPDVTPTPQALRCGRIYADLLQLDPTDPKFHEVRGMYMSALCAARGAVLKKADVLFATCVGSRHAGLVAAARHSSARPMAQIIVDEAGQVTEPETLCSLLLPKDIERIVLVGDPKQLLAIIRSQAAKSLGLGVSLLERLSYTPGANPKLLSLQYRMHPGINAFPSGYFYEGQVVTAANVGLRSPSLMAHPRRPGKPVPLLFWDVDATPHPIMKTATNNAKSYLNSGEAHRVAHLAWSINHACSRKEPPLTVAVLSWYNAQVDVCAQLLADADVHVGGVVTAQGSEWDYVILSAVRGGHGGIGVVGDKNLFNVALTRARLGLCVVGSLKKLRANRLWRRFLSHCLLNDAICEDEPLVMW